MRNLLNCERPSPDFTSFKNEEKLRLQKHLSEGKALRIASCLNLFFVPIWSIILPNQPTFKHFFIVPNLQEWNRSQSAIKYETQTATKSYAARNTATICQCSMCPSQRFGFLLFSISNWSCLRYRFLSSKS